MILLRGGRLNAGLPAAAWEHAKDPVRKDRILFDYLPLPRRFRKKAAAFGPAARSSDREHGIEPGVLGGIRA